MQPYNASTLISQIKSANSAPTARLLALFDQLNNAVHNTQITIDPMVIFTDELTDFYLTESKKTTAEHPDTLAAHLLLIAQKSLLDALSAEKQNNSLKLAREAAAALIQAQCKPAPHKALTFFQHHWFGLAASTVLMTSLSWYLWSSYQINTTPIETTANIATIAESPTEVDVNAKLTAMQASDMYHQYEMMRNGRCRFIEAIQIPDEHKDIYIKSVVGGLLPKSLNDLKIANDYLKKIQCSYTPMLMKKST